MLLAEQRLAFGALAPTRLGAAFLCAKATPAPLQRGIPVGQMRLHVRALRLANAAAADFIAIFQSLPVLRAEVTAAVLTGSGGRERAAPEDASKLTGAGHVCSTMTTAAENKGSRVAES